MAMLVGRLTGASQVLLKFKPSLGVDTITLQAIAASGSFSAGNIILEGTLKANPGDSLGSPDWFSVLSRNAVGMSTQEFVPATYYRVVGDASFNGTAVDVFYQESNFEV